MLHLARHATQSGPSRDNIESVGTRFRTCFRSPSQMTVAVPHTIGSLRAVSFPCDGFVTRAESDWGAISVVASAVERVRQERASSVAAMALLRIPLALFTLGRGQLAEGVCGGRGGWPWSSRVALHTGRSLGAAAGDGVAGVDAGVSLVQGASRGLGLEFVSFFHPRSLAPSFYYRISPSSFSV